MSVPVLRHFFGGEDTRPDFHLNREAINQLLRVLRLERHHGWGPTLETLVFLFWLATGAAYRVVCRAFGMPLPTVHRVVHRVTCEMLLILPRIIHLPQREVDVQSVGNGFAHLAGHRAFQKVAGAMDGCHIRIKCPTSPDGQSYRNRKLFPSVVLQAVCDHQGHFIDIFVGYQGSVHDARILRNSPIYARGTYPPPGYFILADGGYPCHLSFSVDGLPLLKSSGKVMWPVLCAIHLNPIVVFPSTLICGNKQTTELHLLVDIAADLKDPLVSCGMQCQLKKTAPWSSLTSFVVKSFYSMLHHLSKLAFIFFSLLYCGIYRGIISWNHCTVFGL